MRCINQRFFFAQSKVYSKSLPLLARLGGLALEGTGGPLLELGGSLLVSGSCDVCHYVQLLIKKEKMLSFTVYSTVRNHTLLQLYWLLALNKGLSTHTTSPFHSIIKLK